MRPRNNSLKQVKEFPSLRDITVSTEEGHNHFYSSECHTGFIEYRLWTMRRFLSPSKRKYKNTGSAKFGRGQESAHYSGEELLGSKDLEEKKMWMKHTVPKDIHKREIVNCLKSTFPNRRQWILSKHPSVTEIFNEYPRLADYEGEMIELEFSTLHQENASKFLARFGAFYAPRIQGMVKAERPDIIRKLADADITDDNLKAIIMLAELMPPANSKVKQPNKKEGTDVTSTISDKQKDSICIVQPYMLCVQSETEMKYGLVADGKLVCFEEAGALNAFDKLFKLHYVCNLEFSKSLSSFYNFGESYLCDVTDVKPRSFNVSLNAAISHIKL
ncbi:uncharacterized protein LOC134530173 [Bacillus rossius redtenbacheri]|uniref:uncharacterized protein LOC134530173 n=1 Tax=Bacillus rossius redtenbacheri TaxID=93214 RepID=UPI002FDCCF97